MSYPPPPPPESAPPGPPGPPSPYPGYPRYPYPPPHYSAGPSPSKAMAIWALVLAVLGICGVTAVVAIVLAIVVLSRVRSGRAAGKGMAIAALVISALWVVLLAVLVVVGVIFGNSLAERDADGDVVKSGRVFMENLREGDCLEDLGKSDVVRMLTALPCDEPHRHQVVGVFDLDEGPFPGQTEVDRLSQIRCFELMADFTGSERSGLEISYFRPGPDEWSLDRGVLCVGTSAEIVTHSFEE